MIVELMLYMLQVFVCRRYVRYESVGSGSTSYRKIDEIIFKLMS